MSSAVTGSRITEFSAAVGSFLPAEAIGGPHDRCTVDGMSPAVVITPRTAEEIARVLADARAHQLAVIVVGDGTQLGIGNLPSAYDVALSTDRLDAIVAHEPGDMTVTVQAGAKLAAVQQALAAHRQRLPLDPPVRRGATIGGVLATNAYGPLRHSHGTARDWVIGMQVALADGSVVKSGGRVVKNVTGYDMHKLHIGALGTLGAITEVTFKVAPIAPASAAVAASFGSARDACRFALAARDAGLAVESAEALVPAAAHAVLQVERWGAMIEVAGVQSAVERTLRDLRALAASHGGALQAGDGARARWDDAFIPRVTSLRAFVDPSAIEATLEVLDRLVAGAGARISSTVASGVIRIQLPSEAAPGSLVAAIRDLVASRGGTTVVDAASPELKRSLDVFGETRRDEAIMRRLKYQFDPDTVLSPGRFVGRL